MPNFYAESEAFANIFSGIKKIRPQDHISFKQYYCLRELFLCVCYTLFMEPKLSDK